MQLPRFAVSISVLITLMALRSAAQAATVSAASCAQSAVQTAVNTANANDTVAIPAGTCTWSSPVNVTKGITIQGAGESSTVINLGGNYFMTVRPTTGN